MKPIMWKSIGLLLAVVIVVSCSKEQVQNTGPAVETPTSEKRGQAMPSFTAIAQYNGNNYNLLLSQDQLRTGMQDAYYAFKRVPTTFKEVKIQQASDNPNMYFLKAVQDGHAFALSLVAQNDIIGFPMGWLAAVECQAHCCEECFVNSSNKCDCNRNNYEGACGDNDAEHYCDTEDGVLVPGGPQNSLKDVGRFFL